MKTSFAFIWILLLFSVILANCQFLSEPVTTFYLVRHAEKAMDGTEDPDLSEPGHQRAVAIAIMLRDQSVDRLYATSYKRTQQTLQPLADSLGLTVLVYDHNDARNVKKMIADCKGKTAVVAGHTNTTPQLANSLIGKEIYPELDDSDYSKMWKIVLKGNKAAEHHIIEF